MTITATVTHTKLRNGAINRYVVTLSNGTVAKREGKMSFSHLVLPINKSGSTTYASNDLQRLIREHGWRENVVFVETATGKIVNAGTVAAMRTERKERAKAAQQAAQQKRLQQFVEKAPQQVLRRFNKSLELFRGWLVEWAGKDQDRVDRLNDLIAWRERCIEMVENLERADLIGLFNTGTTTDFGLEYLIENSTNQPK